MVLFKKYTIQNGDNTVATIADIIKYVIVAPLPGNIPVKILILLRS
jgi:hypothetical protein